MTDNDDIRWIQRLDNYSRALSQLKRFAQKEKLNDLEEQGLIQAFEYTHELAWNTLKDYLQLQGEQSIHGSRDATRKAFSVGILTEGNSWMDMVKDRNQTSHTYNEDTAHRISNNIKTRYISLFIALEATMQALKNEHS